MFSIVKRKVDKVNTLSDDNPSQDKPSAMVGNELKSNSNVLFLKNKLETLPSELNSLMHMLYGDALTYEQIAVIENCSKRTIEQRFLRAITLLKN